MQRKYCVKLCMVWVNRKNLIVNLRVQPWVNVFFGSMALKKEPVWYRRYEQYTLSSSREKNICRSWVFIAYLELKSGFHLVGASLWLVWERCKPWPETRPWLVEPKQASPSFFFHGPNYSMMKKVSWGEFIYPYEAGVISVFSLCKSLGVFGTVWERYICF